ncbi:sperm motility kinase 2A-like [Acomys russatus]|uniref:sperm motility kinase 2A-like n=1 Tax=Acomys russatus TaxID=60746 RepID=UPI0021E32BF9|nr:sperm motility kinase 2A-like [Acomys russatus]
MSTPSDEESPEPSPQPSFSEKENFHSQYKIIKTIGQGSNAKVHLAHHRLTGTPVAVKVVVKKEQLITSEAEIMMMTNHPNIVSLLQVIESERRIYLVMELVEGQQLYQHIRESGHLEEDEARGIFRQITAAVSYCHNVGIIHRDLKPDNIMLERNGRVKIIDFGLGTQVYPGQRLSQQCGAYSFGAPELFQGRLYDGTKIDIWTLGVVLYYMVVGRVPFDTVILSELRNKVVSGKYFIPSELSKELRDLISLLLTVNPKYRPTINEVLTHPWLKKHTEGFHNHPEEMIPRLADPAVLKAMGYIGFKSQEIKNSLEKKTFNQAMACYYFLKGQILQGQGCTSKPPFLNPGVTPFPSLEDPAAFPLKPRRRGSEPALGSLLRSSSGQEESACGQKWGPNITDVDPTLKGASVDPIPSSGVHLPIKPTAPSGNTAAGMAGNMVAGMAGVALEK